MLHRARSAWRIGAAARLALARAGSTEATGLQFTKVAPGTPPVAAWGEREGLLAGAGVSTQCVHAGCAPDAAFNAVAVPIYTSSTYALTDVATTTGFEYARDGNPTRAALEAALTMLERGEGAACTSSGMSAIMLALNLLPKRSQVICTLDCYGGTYSMLEHARRHYGLDVVYMDMRRLDDLRRAVKPGVTGMVWVESPSNPLLRVTDVAAVADIARAAGALTVVDNTFMSPVLARPLEMGADLVVHSTTKFLNGHSDVVGGAVIAKKGDRALADRLGKLNTLMGTGQSPQDCFLVLRGLKTLKLRVMQHQANATAATAFLRDHPAVASVNYPGMGGVLSFELKKGDIETAFKVLRGFKLFTLAASVGGVESLVAHPTTMTHAPMTPAARAAAGISDTLIRLSVGIEDSADQLADLKQVLDKLL